MRCLCRWNAISERRIFMEARQAFLYSDMMETVWLTYKYFSIKIIPHVYNKADVMWTDK